MITVHIEAGWTDCDKQRSIKNSSNFEAAGSAHTYVRTTAADNQK